jgi:tight adherence protein C
MQLWQLLALIALLLGVGVYAEVIWLKTLLADTSAEDSDRLLMAPVDTENGNEGLFRRAILPLLLSLGKYPRRILPASQLERVRFQLGLLGYFIAPEMIWGAALILGVFGLLLAILVLRTSGFEFPLNLIVLVMFSIGGLYMPQLWLNRRQRALERMIRRDFPGVIDIMRSCMVAGLTFDSAMAEIATHRESLFGREFARVLDEIKLGRSRAEALKALADRLGVEDVSDFVEGVLRSLPMGAPIGNIFEIQSTELRRRRIQRAEEAAQRTPIKIMIPMVGCMLPAIFVILMGPAVLTIFVAKG